MGKTNKGYWKFRSKPVIDTLDVKILNILSNKEDLLLLELEHIIKTARKNTLIHIKRLNQLGLITLKKDIRQQTRVKISEKGIFVERLIGN